MFCFRWSVPGVDRKDVRRTVVIVAALAVIGAVAILVADGSGGSQGQSGGIRCSSIAQCSNLMSERWGVSSSQIPHLHGSPGLNFIGGTTPTLEPPAVEAFWLNFRTPTKPSASVQLTIAPPPDPEIIPDLVRLGSFTTASGVHLFGRAGTKATCSWMFTDRHFVYQISALDTSSREAQSGNPICAVARGLIDQLSPGTATA